MKLWIPLLAVVLSGCSSLSYYGQAAVGGISLLTRNRAIDAVLEDPRSPEALKAQLGIVVEVLDFAAVELGLPDNGSYRSYAELDRPYATWVVTAAPEFSLEPVTWCFPVAGCVSYRGYFSQRRARAFAERNERRGYDVTVSGARAFSTLGWFRDPVLSTFVFDAPAELAAVLIHELAHQKVYVKGDTRFNESFASFVETVGTKRWLLATGETEALAEHERSRGRRREANELLASYRARLEELYSRRLAKDELRSAKARVLAELAGAYRDLETAWRREDGAPGTAEPRSWNNADLAAIEAYYEWTPAFAALLESSGGSLPRFYEAVAGLAALSEEARVARMRALAAASDSVGGAVSVGGF